MDQLKMVVCQNSMTKADRVNPALLKFISHCCLILLERPILCNCNPHIIEYFITSNVGCIQLTLCTRLVFTNGIECVGDNKKAISLVKNTVPLQISCMQSDQVMYSCVLKTTKKQFLNSLSNVSQLIKADVHTDGDNGIDCFLF